MWKVTITFIDGTTRQRSYSRKGEALRAQRFALMSRIVSDAVLSGEAA